VIRPTRVTSIGRTLLSPACFPDLLQAQMCRASYGASLMGYPLRVEGFPFISQDTDVTRCAHAACWMCFRYYSEQDPTHNEIYPYQIAESTQYLYDGRLRPSSGLYMGQVAELFARNGFSPLLYARSALDAVQKGKFERVLYSYIESGIPVVLCLENTESQAPEGHAVVGFGHLSDLTRVPTANPASSSDYMIGIVINDDNGLPYEVLCEAPNSTARRQSRFLVKNIDSFVVPLPEKVCLSAHDAERMVLALLGDTALGTKTRSPFLANSQLVIRLHLRTSQAYKTHCRRQGLPHQLELLYTQLPMPRHVWIAEISTTALYPEGNVLGEIVLDATASDQDQLAWLLIHYPEFLKVNDRDSMLGAMKGERLLDGGAAYGMFRQDCAV
jgi:hypothetical protein